MFEIDFYVNGKRKTIPLGVKYTEQTAIELKGIVETLLRYNDNSIAVLDKRTQTWIETAGPEIREKLAKAGLIELPPSHTLKELWDAFHEQKAREQKAGLIVEDTLTLYGYARKRFFRFFKENELLEDLTQDRMQRWKDHLLDDGSIVERTVARYLKDAKACFNWAVKTRWIEKSPLDGIGRGSFVNKANDRVVSMSDYRRFLDACPSQEWRTIVALVRVGGLRCPSEVLKFRWQDVYWDHNGFYVHSPKTKSGRWIPLFPELKEELEALFFHPISEGQEFVINRYRDSSQNLRTTFAKIVERAGYLPFPRPFDNMRMIRSNEIRRRFPDQESAWLGHSARVFEEHYSVVMDTDFQAAAGWITPSNEPKSGKTENTGSFPAKIPAAQDGIGLYSVESIQRANQR